MSPWVKALLAVGYLAVVIALAIYLPCREARGDDCRK